MYTGDRQYCYYKNKDPNKDVSNVEPISTFEIPDLAIEHEICYSWVL